MLNNSDKASAVIYQVWNSVATRICKLRVYLMYIYCFDLCCFLVYAGRRRCDTIGDLGDHGQAVRRTLVGNRHGHGLAGGCGANGQADPRHGGVTRVWWCCFGVHDDGVDSVFCWWWW